MIKIGILGGTGRMGKMIAAEIETGKYPVSIGAAPARGNSAEAFETCDVLIDFTTPEGTMEHAALAHQYAKPLIVGTTGLGPVEHAALKTASIKAPVLVSGNMSLGVNILLSLVEQTAAKLKADYDIEIFEAHHRHKVDAPSGTALMLGEAAAKARGVTLKDSMMPARYGQIGARVPGSIGFSVFRGGDVIGDHTVTFAGMGERLELSHKASDRSLFARGAIEAAIWLPLRAPGFYSMRDVLNI